MKTKWIDHSTKEKCIRLFDKTLLDAHLATLATIFGCKMDTERCIQSPLCTPLNGFFLPIGHHTC